MLRFDSNEDFVEIGFSRVDSAELPSKEDAYLTIRLFSAGFAGQNDLWVSGSAFRSFCRSLIALEQNRKGEALLESISPKELRLVICSIGSRGHMLIQGTTGYEVQRENSRVWHSVEFGFEFDPSQLLKAVAINWVQKNAADSSI